jgi:hypothetical protein
MNYRRNPRWLVIFTGRENSYPSIGYQKRLLAHKSVRNRDTLKRLAADVCSGRAAEYFVLRTRANAASAKGRIVRKADPYAKRSE